jgi:hypothetical protein
MKSLLRNPKHWLYLACHIVVLLIGYILCQQNPTSIWFAVGSSLIAGGIAGLVIFVYVWMAEQVSTKLDILNEFGFTAAFDARSVRIKQEYVQRLEKAGEEIDIIGFGLSSFREDFLDDFSKWKQRANVRILLLDPDFPGEGLSYANQRDTEEKNPPGKITNDVKKFVEAVGNLIGQDGDRAFGIRLYRCLPTLNIFRIDNELFWGPYLVGEQSRNSPTFVVRRGGILFDRFTKQFDCIWKDDNFSRPVPIEWLKPHA